MGFDTGDKVIDKDGFFGIVEDIDDEYIKVKFDEFNESKWVNKSYLMNCKDSHFPIKIKSVKR